MQGTRYWVPGTKYKVPIKYNVQLYIPTYCTYVHMIHTIHIVHTVHVVLLYLEVCILNMVYIVHMLYILYILYILYMLYVLTVYLPLSSTHIRTHIRTPHGSFTSSRSTANFRICVPSMFHF